MDALKRHLTGLVLLALAVGAAACSDDDDDDEDWVPPPCEITAEDCGPSENFYETGCTCICDVTKMTCGEFEEPDNTDCTCKPMDIRFTVSPNNGGSFGETEVTFTATQPIFAGRDVENVRVLIGEVDLIFKQITSDTTLVGVTQGHPAPSVDNDKNFKVGLSILFRTNPDAEPTVLPEWETMWEADDVFTYQPPIDPVFNNFWAIGASFAAGFQANSLNAPAQLMGPVTQVARQVGAYFPLPLAKDPGIPPAPSLADVDKANGNLEQDLEEALILIIPSLATKNNFLGLRENPYTFSHNLSVPGGVVSDILLSAQGSLSLLENFIQDPFTLGTINVRPPIDIIEEASPTIVVSSVDVFGNDVLGGDDNDTRQIEADLDQLFGRFAALESQPMLFILSLPDVNALPGEDFKQDERYEVIRADNALARAAARANEGKAVPRIIFGDFFKIFVDLFEASPGDFLESGGASFEVVAGPNGEPNFIITDLDGEPQQMSLDRFGGLISFDDLHLTDTGYAWLSNVIIQSMNDTIGPEGQFPRLKEPVPYIDLAAVVTSDPYGPKNLAISAQALGFPPLETYTDTVLVPPLSFADRCAIEFNESLGLTAEDGCPVTIEWIGPAELTTQRETNVPFTVRVLDKDGAPMAGIPVIADIWNTRTQGDRIQPERGIVTDADGLASFTYEPRNEKDPTEFYVQAGSVVETYTMIKTD